MKIYFIINNMIEHEKFKIICDKIWFLVDYHYDKDDWFYDYNVIWEAETINLRIIIFTQEFMNKYKQYAWKINDSYKYYDFLSEITLWLDNPVEYLYNLLFQKW